MAINKRILRKENEIEFTKNAAAALNPGHLVEVTSANKVQKHSTEGGYAERFVALEYVYTGGSIDDAYASGDEVVVRSLQSNDVAYMYIKAGVDVAVGEALISAGDGTLIGESDAGSGVTVKQIIGYATAAVDLTASGAVATRTNVRIK